MRVLSAVISSCLTSAANAACPWTDDGQLANAIMGSAWQVTTLSGYERIADPEPGKYQLSVVPETRRIELYFGAVLQDNRFDGTLMDLVFIGESDLQDGSMTIGQNTFSIPYPSREATGCSGAGLSHLLLTVRSPSLRLFGPQERLESDTWLMLSVADEDRLIGLLRLAGQVRNNVEGAGLYLVEASPLP